MTYKLGLTGSIGMGKSTTAEFFADAGVPVWDADAAVARLYAPGGPGVAAVAGLAPAAIREGGVDRAHLKVWLGEDPERHLRRLEEAVHPLVAEDRQEFIDRHAGVPLVVFDIPLLFETGAEAWLDGVLVVTAPVEEQRRRVLARPGMTEEQFGALLARQLPDAAKRVRADFVIETRELEPAREDVHALVRQLRGVDRNA